MDEEDLLANLLTFDERQDLLFEFDIAEEGGSNGTAEAAERSGVSPRSRTVDGGSGGAPVTTSVAGSSGVSPLSRAVVGGRRRSTPCAPARPK